jgi:hypothetical protein
MHFSKITQCFYPDDISYPELPVDIVDVPQEDFNNAMSRNPGDTLDVVNGRVVVVPNPAPTATQLKAEKWDAIKAKRDAVSGGGVKVGTKWYHTDETSRAKYMGLVRMADSAVVSGGSGSTTLQYAGQDIQWKTMDGSFIKMTVQCANDVFNAVSGLDFTAFAAAETHRVAMEASADPSSYDFSGGWPKVFGE